MVTPTFLPLMVAVFGTAVVPLFAVARRLARRKGRRLNEQSRCARCGRDWVAGPSGLPDAYVVEGQVLCPSCASQMRRRTVVAGLLFLALASAMFFYSWGPFAGLFRQYGIIDGIAGLTGWAWTLFLPPLLLLGGADWTLRRMKATDIAALDAIARARLFRSSASGAAKPDAQQLAGHRNA